MRGIGARGIDGRSPNDVDGEAMGDERGEEFAEVGAGDDGSDWVGDMSAVDRSDCGEGSGSDSDSSSLRAVTGDPSTKTAPGLEPER